MALDNALPWFPLTPDYIDKYHDDVLKYLRDSLMSEDIDVSQDRSFSTTASLLMQRAEELRAGYLSMSVLDAQSLVRTDLEKDVKTIASAALYCLKFEAGKTMYFMSMLCYLLSLLCPESSDSLSKLIIKCLMASSLKSVGYGMDDVMDFSASDFCSLIENSEFELSGETRWFQNHGTVKVTPDGVSLYPMSRLFAIMKSGSMRSVLSIEDSMIQVMQDKKSGKSFAFDVNRFLVDCSDVKEDEEKITLKVYEDGDRLSVRISGLSYDTMSAESIDPAYERLSAPVRITLASNVRGLYMTDFARNLNFGDVINVTYEENEGCFSLDETVLDFIYDNYWKEQEDGTTFESTVGMLLFKHDHDIPNTWLTREGFLVRSEDDEPYERFSQKRLNIADYDEKYDFIIAEVGEDASEDEKFTEVSARDNFIHYFLYKSKKITSPAPKKEEVMRIPPELLTELHRVESTRYGNPALSSSDRRDILSVSELLSCILGDEEDFNYYGVRLDYHDAVVTFAKRDYGSIKPLDKRSLSGQNILTMEMMSQVLGQYGKHEESEILDSTIEQHPGTSMSAVAKLVQAANRFMGTPSLERLLVDLHREICALLGVTDAITADKEEEDRFPFGPEGESIEHKMSWVIDNGTGEFNETAQSFKCMKTICAFMNRYSEQGDGHLYIGTDEKRHFVSGIQNDLEALIQKGELKATGDVGDEYMRQIVMRKIMERFPDAYQNVSPSICCEGKVLDLCVHPAKEGVIRLNGTAYYRSGSSSMIMSPVIEEEMRNRKYLLRSGMAGKIDAVRRAINGKQTVCLVGYDSSSSNTSDRDRKVEAFAYTDMARCDSIWAFDPKDRKNKVFHLRRADDVKVLDESWKFEKQHQTHDLDIFGFSGDERIPLEMTLKTTRAKNQFLDQNPSAASSLLKSEDGSWLVRTELFNSLSMEAACGFYMTIPDDVDISASPLLKKKVNERIEKMLSRM